MQKIKTLNYNYELYVNKNYTKIEEALSTCFDMESQIKLAKALLLKGDYLKSAQLYKVLNNHFLEGYANLLAGNFTITQKLWKDLEETSPLIAWGKSLMGFINLHVIKYPTFFQIRNFLEVDLNALLVAGQKEYAENIMSGLNVFAEINPESYKYVARVLLNHRYYNISIPLLQKSLDIYYKDPETHYMTAKSYLYLQNKNMAEKYLKSCLSFHPDYLPAKKMLEYLQTG